MPHNDNFGLDDDDDDSLFLAAATQAEATQHADNFEQSPRPHKRRRLTGLNEVDGDGSDGLEWPATELQSQRINSTAAPEAQSQIESEEAYYFPGELGEKQDEKNARNSKYKIAVPRDGGYFQDQIFTQTQADLDADPSVFRGAVWKRPKPAPPPPPLFGATVANQGEARDSAVSRKTMGNGLGGRQSTLSGFGRPAVVNGMRGGKDVDGDAALARRLQDEEDRLSRAPQTVSQAVSQPNNTADDEYANELEDLPSDAFCSSSPEKSPSKEVIMISSQTTASQVQTNGLRAPQQGLKQMTIFGAAATQELSTSQAAKKKHAWPLKSRDEPPTHHKLDEAAMKTWVYPTNLGTIRDYQYNIVARSLYHNTLVALPTGLGKTFIAATVMLNYYRWTTDAQIVFMAPTKPLIAQQMEACYHIVGIPRRDTTIMTGETPPTVRFEDWQSKRVFFMTPQTVINDLKTGGCDPKKIVLIVVDEAHKATGGYAYTEVVKFLRRFNNSFRVLALTATPGSTVEAVQGVVNALGIARVELRTELSIDIQKYTHEKQTETQVFEISDEQALIMEHLSKALQPTVDKLCTQNAYYSRDPMALTAYGLTIQRRKWQSSDAGRKAPQAIKGMINAAFNALASVAHGIGLLKNHGIGPFYSSISAYQRTVDSGENKGKTATGIVQSEHFTKMTGIIRNWTNNPDFMGHPKLEYLREVVLNHFLDTGEGVQGSNVPPSATRVMVFASYRDSTDEICRVLERVDGQMIRPHVFVGQAASKGSEGMNQKKQSEVIQDFKSGKYNTLVATSIGEEGLDIGDVDLIVNYDASASPIRMLQRIGRTGRKRMGRVVLLLMSGKEEKDYAKAQDNYLGIQKSIAEAKTYDYPEDQSTRIIPKEVVPVVDKRIIDIPVENSQPVDLNEKGRRAKGGRQAKRPPKKFHMPDGVRTGFTKASRMNSDAESDEEPAPPKRKTAAKKKTTAAKSKQRSPEPKLQPVPLPLLGDLLLTGAQEQELERKYARTADDDEDAAIRPPDPGAYPQYIRDPGPTKHVPHGRASQVVARTMRFIQSIDQDMNSRMRAILDEGYSREAGPAAHRLVSPADEDDDDEVLPDLVLAKSTVKPKGRPPKAQSTATARNTSFRSAASIETAPKPARAKSKAAPPKKTPAKAPAKAPKRAAAKAPPKPRGRPKKVQHTHSYGSLAAEGEESSPEPTPADMRISTQGIDLGSADTSGEDQEEEADSDDQAFIARSDEIEMRSSSQRLPDDTQTPRSAKRRIKPGRAKKAIVLSDINESDSDEVAEEATGAGANDVASDDDVGLTAMRAVGDGGESSGVEEVTKRVGRPSAAVVRGRKRRVVGDSDSDE